MKQDKAKSLEKAIIEHSKDIAKKRNVPVTWDNEFFCKIYTNKCRSMYANLSNKENKNIAETNKKHRIGAIYELSRNFPETLEGNAG